MNKIFICLFIVIAIVIVIVIATGTNEFENIDKNTIENIDKNTIENISIDKNIYTNTYKVTDVEENQTDSDVKDYNMEERKYNIINDNIYYTDEVISSKANNPEETVKRFEIISEYLNENYPGKKIFISNFNYIILTRSKDANYGLSCIVYQITNDNVVLEDDNMVIYIEDDVVNQKYSMGIDLLANDIDVNINTSELMDIEDIKKSVYKKIDENYSKLGVNSILNKWDFYLGYKENIVYYEFDLGNSSFIKVNAQNGDIIQEYYDSGVIID